MRRADRPRTPWLVALAAGLASGAVACSTLIGADFDVQPAPTSGAGGATTTTGAGGATAGGGAGGASTTPSSDGGGGVGGHGGASTTGAGGATATGGAGQGGAPVDAGPCASGCPPEVVLAHLARPWCVVTDGGYVYVTVSGTSKGATTDGYVLRVPSKGGPVEVVAKDLRMPNQLVVGGGYAYWTSTLLSGGVWRAPVAGNVATPVSTDHLNAIGIALDGPTLYFVADSNIWSIDVASEGGKASVLVPGAGSGLLAHNATSLFWAHADAKSSLRAARKSDGATSDLATAIDHPNGVVADGDFVFFTTMTADGRVGRVDVKDPGKVAWLATKQASPAALAIDGPWLYFTNFEGGTVERVLAVGGAPPVTVASGQGHPVGVALDADYLYWIDYADDGALLRLPRAALPK